MKTVTMHEAEWAEIIDALYIAAAVYNEDADMIEARRSRRPAREIRSLRDLAIRARARARRIAESVVRG